jgi:protein TonB
MLRTLLESQAVHARRTGGTLVSVGVHTAVIALAIVATARATSAPPPRPPEPPPPVTWVEPAVVADPAPPPIIEPNYGIVFPQPTFVQPPEVPELSVTDGFDGAIHEHMEWHEPRLGPGPERGRLAIPTDSIFTGIQVEKAAIPQGGNPAPAYPPTLRAAQIEGSVVAQFVVDTTGLAEPGSITFPESTHAQFAEAVRQSLLRSRYLPAMIGDHRVRQLVQQRFAFTLTR